MAEKNRQPEIPQLTSVGERTPVLLSNQTCEGHPETEQTPAAPLPEQEVVFEGISYAWHTMEVMNHQRENPRSPVGSTGMAPKSEAVWCWADHLQPPIATPET